MHRHLKPGYGHIEQVEIDMRPRCDDGTLTHKPDGSLPDIVRWFNYLEDATTRAHRSIVYGHDARLLLAAQGFVDIEEEVIRLPVNPWPSDPHQKEIGRWYNLGLTEGLEATSLGPFTRCFNWPVRDVKMMVEEVKTILCNKRIHVYNNM